jgi:hypothetical protein
MNRIDILLNHYEIIFYEEKDMQEWTWNKALQAHSIDIARTTLLLRLVAFVGFVGIISYLVELFITTFSDSDQYK